MYFTSALKEEKCWLSGKKLREHECWRPHKVMQNISSLKGNRLLETAASQHFAAYFGLWRKKVKVIFLATTNSCQREIKSAAFLFIREISWDTIFDVATAGKATKVQNEQLTLCAISRGFPPLMRIPFCAATPVPTITAVGVAKPKEQGHAMLSTVIEVWNANLSISSAFERCLFWFCKKREERRQKKKKKIC